MISTADWTTATVRTCTKGQRDVEISSHTMGLETDPCILLVMGLNTQGLMWDDELCKKIASKNFRVIRFDNRCTGLSTKFHHLPASPLWRKELPRFMQGKPAYTFDEMADDAVALLQYLKISAAHWVGQSMGGMISQVAAIRRPQFVLSLTLIMTTSGNQCSQLQTPFWVKLNFLKKAKSNSVDDVTEFKLSFGKRISWYGCEFDEELVRPRTRAAVERSQYNGTQRQLWAALSAPCRDEALGKLTIPCTVIHGIQDVMVPVSNGINLASVIPGSKLVMLDNMSHCLPTWHYARYVKEIEEVVQRSSNKK